ncbi:hypothetical protein VTN77DRAFT_3065 [Rasamsonia byssochlamydoides]|uniref:uncharacterized protein n=1 Tax=Rasamsonia byssochlamydoides TaxID=89139 RepID=UPI0037437EA4
MADENSSDRPSKRLKTGRKPNNPRLVGSAAVDCKDFANRGSGTSASTCAASGDTELLRPSYFAEHQGQANLPPAASASRHVSPKDNAKFSLSYSLSPSYRDNSRSVSSPETTQKYRVQDVEDPFISPLGSEGLGSPYRESIEEDNTSQRRVMWTEERSRSQRERQLLTVPPPPFSPLERWDYERRRNSPSLTQAQVTQGRPRSMEPPSVPILSQPSPPKRAFVRGSSVPQETACVPETDGRCYHAGFTHRSPGARPNVCTYDGIQESLDALRNTIANLTGRTGEEIGVRDDSSSDERPPSKEAAQRRRPSVGLNFDPESERQRELEERAAAEVYGQMSPIGECRYLWFGVILIFVAMFLCLFLYSFGVIK